MPIESVGVGATPYQPNLSNIHVKKLEGAICKIGQFLDSIIAIRAVKQRGRGVEETRGKEKTETTSKYWTPNGHRPLSAMRTLGAKSITAIVVPEVTVAYQTLALKTEKAHNLREKALKVIRLFWVSKRQAPPS